MSEVGDTDTEPLVAPLVENPPLPVQVVASEELHVRVEDPPEEIEVGAAVRVATGTGSPAAHAPQLLPGMEYVEQSAAVAVQVSVGQVPAAQLVSGVQDGAHAPQLLPGMEYVEQSAAVAVQVSVGQVPAAQLVSGVQLGHASGSGAIQLPPENEPEVLLQAFALVQGHPSMSGWVAQVATT